MSGTMGVDVDEVRAMAGDLAAFAERVAGSDPATPVGAAAASLPGSDTASALGPLPAALASAIASAADRLLAMSGAAERTAAGYEATEAANAARLAVGGR